MRAQASSIPGVTWHGGVAEDTGLSDGAFDIVVFAQSWHWVDSELAGREAARILTPGGTLGIVWNQMDVSIPWVHRLTRIMRSGDVHRPDRPPTPGGGFTPMRLTQITWEDIMTPRTDPHLGDHPFLVHSVLAGRAGAHAGEPALVPLRAPRLHAGGKRCYPVHDPRVDGGICARVSTRATACS